MKSLNRKSALTIEPKRARILVMPSQADIRRQVLHDRDRDEFLELESLYFRIKNRIADRARLSTDSLS